MATHSNVPAWRIPGSGEPGGLPSMGSHRVGHDWSDLTAAAAALIEVKVCASWHAGTGKPAARSVYVFQFICGNSNLQCDGVSGWGSLGCDWIMKVEPSWIGLVPFLKGPQRAPLLPSPCADTVRRHKSMNQEAGSHQTPNTQAHWCWVPRFQTVRNFCYLKPHFSWYSLQQSEQSR